MAAEEAGFGDRSEALSNSEGRPGIAIKIKVWLVYCCFATVLGFVSLLCLCCESREMEKREVSPMSRLPVRMHNLFVDG